MKSRDEFVKSVWEKSEKALAEEKKKDENLRFFCRNKHKMSRTFVAAAVCVLVVAGTVSIGGPEAIYENLFILGTDAAATESMFEKDEQEVQNSAMDREPVSHAAGDTADGETDSMDSSATITADGALDFAVLEDEALYGELKKQTEEALKSEDATTPEGSKSEDLQMYYFLPIGVRIEDFEGNLLVDVTDEESIKKYMKWFYLLPEEQVLTNEEFEKVENPSASYKFTMDCSMGADTDSVDRNFWIQGDIQIP